MLDNILRDITKAKQHGAYLSALAIALTLPNILSNIEYEKRTGRTEYIEWFDTWVYKFYKQPISENQSINKGVAATNFDGKMCYALRCSVLHAGNTDLDDRERNVECFELCVSDVSAHCGDTFVCGTTENDTKGAYISLNVKGLIDSIIQGANEYISQNRDKFPENGDYDDVKMFGSIKIINNKEQ